MGRNQTAWEAFTNLLGRKRQPYEEDDYDPDNASMIDPSQMQIRPVDEVMPRLTSVSGRDRQLVNLGQDEAASLSPIFEPGQHSRNLTPDDEQFNAALSRRTSGLGPLTQEAALKIAADASGEVKTRYGVDQRRQGRSDEMVDRALREYDERTAQTERDKAKGKETNEENRRRETFEGGEKAKDRTAQTERDKAKGKETNEESRRRETFEGGEKAKDRTAKATQDEAANEIKRFGQKLEIDKFNAGIEERRLKNNADLASGDADRVQKAQIEAAKIEQDQKHVDIMAANAGVTLANAKNIQQPGYFSQGDPVDNEIRANVPRILRDAQRRPSALPAPGTVAPIQAQQPLTMPQRQQLPAPAQSGRPAGGQPEFTQSATAAPRDNVQGDNAAELTKRLGVTVPQAVMIVKVRKKYPTMPEAMAKKLVQDAEAGVSAAVARMRGI